MKLGSALLLCLQLRQSRCCQPPQIQSTPTWMHGLPPRVSSWVAAAGIQSSADLAGFWDNASEIADLALRCGWFPTEQTAFEEAWRQAHHRARQSLAAVQVVSGAPPVVPTAAHEQRGVSPQAAIVPKTLPLHVPASEPAAFEDPAPQRPVVTNTLLSKETKRRGSHLESLRALWLRAGALGLHWKPGAATDIDERCPVCCRARHCWTCREEGVKSQLKVHTTAALHPIEPTQPLVE